MNKEQIKEFLDILISDDEKKLFEYLKITKEISNEEFDDVMQKKMREIELGDYEYFKSLLIDSKYTEWIIYFMQFSSEKEELKDLLERREELELSKESIKLLIKSVNDSQYTDYWIKEEKS